MKPVLAHKTPVLGAMLDEEVTQSHIVCLTKRERLLDAWAIGRRRVCTHMYTSPIKWRQTNKICDRL